VTVPTKPGFYWAKWRIAEDDTPAELAATLPCDTWGVVEVFENYIGEKHDNEKFRVAVPGVRESQLLENFIWGPHSTLLTPPEAQPVRFNKPDFTVGMRGGAWYGFSNCRPATEFIRKNGVVTADNKAALTRRLEQAGFTWKDERE
jgi:hypothetical protein